MDIYSTTLGLAAGLCGLAAVALAVGKLKGNPKALRICKLASAAALIFDFVSMLVHRFIDHASDSADFFKIHPAFIVVAVIAILILIMERRL